MGGISLARLLDEFGASESIETHTRRWPVGHAPSSFYSGGYICGKVLRFVQDDNGFWIVYGELFFECGFVGFGDQGVLLEIVVVAIGEVGAVVGAAAFFASESGAGNKRSEAVKIL